MSRKYKIHDQADLHFVTYVVVNWVDALSRPLYKDVVVESLAYCQQSKGLELYAWCIMSNHVHLIAKASEGNKLEDILRDHKKFTAKRIVGTIEQNGQESRAEWMLPMLRSIEGTIRFWQHDLHPIWLRSPDVIEQKLNYIHMNPVKEGFVAEPHHYLYSPVRSLGFLPSDRMARASGPSVFVSWCAIFPKHVRDPKGERSGSHLLRHLDGRWLGGCVHSQGAGE